ncbi:MAG: hypothetical protein QOC87_17 [Actinomycetota bacterium]|nr:hypothetical protein [Actinomycetota bacterium]
MVVGRKVLTCGFAISIFPAPRVPGRYACGQMTLKRLMWLVFIAFAVFFIIQQPAAAAHLVKNASQSLTDFFGTAAHALSKFVKSLA